MEIYKLIPIIFVFLTANFFSQSDTVLYKNAVSVFNLKKYEEATKLFQKVIDINPKYINAYHKQALSLARLSKFKDAILVYKNYLKIDSFNVSVYTNIGSMYQYDIKSKTEDPLWYFLKAYTIDSTNSLTLYHLGIYYSNVKDKFKDAENWYLKSLNYACEALKQDIYYDFGMLYYKNKLYKKAILCFSKTIDANKNYSDAYYYRSMCYLQIDEPEKEKTDRKLYKKTRNIKTEQISFPCDFDKL